MAPEWMTEAWIRQAASSVQGTSVEEAALAAELQSPPPLPDNWPEIRDRIWNKIQSAMKQQP